MSSDQWSSLPDRSRFMRCWREQGFHGNETVAAAIARGVSARGEAELIFHSDQRPARATLRELDRRSRALAGALHRLGLRQGDVLAIQVPNWIEGMLAYLAAFQLGAVLVPIIHVYGPREVSFILRASRARIFLCPDRWRNIDYIARLAQVDLAEVRHVVVIGDGVHPGTRRWADLADDAVDEFPASTARSDDPCVMIYTSGTTADPKGVVHTHNSLIAANRMYEQLGGAGPDATVLGVGPAGHIGGVRNAMRLFLTGGTTIVLDAWNAEAAARLIAAHDVSQCAGGSPYFLATLLDAAAALDIDLSRVTRFTVGGASVPASLVERADAAGLVAGRAYGSTEVPSVTAFRNGDPLEKRAGTDGRPSPGGEIRLLDEEGREIADGEAGEVALRAPFMFQGYADAALNRTAFTDDGWFLTGDIGRLDRDGHLSITDRKKDIIIRGGENISSKEVEDVLATHPAIFEAAVTAMPDAAMGEKVCAFVHLRESASLDLAAVRAHFVAAGVAKPKTPERLILVDALPRTAAGKVKKFELRQRLRQMEGSAG